MARIVVSYRRLDSAAIAGRIFDRLSQRYGAGSVFMDIDNIPAGVDFRERIGEALQASDALIVVMGPKWLDPKKRGHTTIHDETDWVRIELETALQQKIPVIPALVQGATMPKADQLPPSLRDFAFRNAATVDAGQDFNTHIERLTRAIDQMLPTVGEKPGEAEAPETKRRTGLLVGVAVWAVLVALIIVGATWPRVPELFTPASFQKKEADPNEPRWVSGPPSGATQIAKGPSATQFVVTKGGTIPRDEQQTGGLSSGEIVARYGNSTVMITESWSLYDIESGQPIYQKTLLSGGVRLPAYVRLSNNNVVRWLTTSNVDGNNIKIGAAQPGTGFIVESRGFIVTNKHIAAPWGTYFPPAEQAGFLVSGDGTGAARRIDIGGPGSEDLWTWVPEDGSYVFASDKPTMLGNSPRKFFGKADALAVRFLGSKLDINADLVRSSKQVDLALIKIFAPQPLEPIPLSPVQIAVGERITVLGYPVPATSVVAAYPSERTYRRAEPDPAPSAIEGIIARLSPPRELTSLGEVFQLSINLPSAASGSPVFNAEGKVIGVVAYTIGSATYAVPISHAQELLKPQLSP